MDEGEWQDSYYGDADLLIRDEGWGGTADLNRTATGWDGWFEFDSSAAVEAVRELAKVYLGAPWPAKIQIRGKPVRDTTVVGDGQRVEVSGTGTPPWEDE